MGLDKIIEFLPRCAKLSPGILRICRGLDTGGLTEHEARTLAVRQADIDRPPV